MKHSSLQYIKVVRAAAAAMCGAYNNDPAIQITREAIAILRHELRRRTTKPDDLREYSPREYPAAESRVDEGDLLTADPATGKIKKMWL